MANDLWLQEIESAKCQPKIISLCSPSHAIEEDELTNRCRFKRRHLGNGAVSTAARCTSAFKVGREVLIEDDAVAARSGGTASLLVGGDVLGEDDAVSARARGASALSVGGELSGLDGGEGIHLRNEGVGGGGSD